MNEIKVGGSWAYYDQLDGEDITEADTLEVEMPDGSLHTVWPKIETDQTWASDHGHDCCIPITRAYVEVEEHGAKLRLYLKGLKARRVPREVGL